jgi:hypothetical protein
MAKTRGRPVSKTDKETTESTPVATGPKTQLGTEAVNPPQLFILPENLSTEARIVQLENPRTSTNSPYVICPETGFYEFTRVATPKSTPRSWLLSSELRSLEKVGKEEKQKAKSDSHDKFSNNGYILRNANLLVATPIDTLFLTLPALTSKSESKGSEKKLFLSGEDYLEKVATDSPEIRTLLKNDSVRELLEKRMAVICDTVDVGDEMMYRISEEKLLAELLRKASKMVRKGLTPSMEEKFVRKALDVPTPLVVVEEFTESTTSTPQAETPDTQSTTLSTDSVASSFSETSTVATSFSGDASATIAKPVVTLTQLPIEAPEGIADLLRLRTALSFVCSKYLSPKMSDTVKSLATSSISGKDFAPLDNHLAHLAKLRQEAFATRALGDASRKRIFDEDDEDGNGESRAEKKRKKEEEEKRKKAGESRGVKNLKKVNVSGMKKMSDFFKKK